MPRIPYPTDEELSDEVRAQLAALPPFNLARTLAWAPTLLAPFLALGGAILSRCELDPRLRELAILQVARSTGATYERVQHEQIARSLGISDAEIAAAASGDPGPFDHEARLVLRAAEEITRGVSASDATLAELLERLGRRRTTELVVTVAYYGAVARVLETAGVEIEEKLAALEIAKGIGPR